MGIVEDLESAIDIVDLVSKYTTLKKSGANYKSICPFPGHSENTPSFVVSKSKQLGYCFGCHKGGGPLKFIMDIENCEFKEAIEILGNFTGIKVNHHFDKQKFETKKSLYSLYKDSVSYYQNALQRYPEVKKYLMDRGLAMETIQKFYFGYADNGMELYNYLKKKGYDDQIIADAKIFIDLKSRKDKFINRIIFPIQNQRGDFIALAGRVIGDGDPKYLNSPASNIYDKSSVLYGLYNARNSITKEDFIIITEGYMDTITLQEAGFFNTVSVSGTALTEKHLTIIKRFTHKIYLCFDGDKAGINATKLSLETMKNKGFEVKIIILPKGKDPDDIIKSGKDFSTFIQNAVTPIGYYMQKSKFNLESVTDKKNALNDLLEMIKSYSDRIEQDFYLKEISKFLDINSKIVYDTFNKLKFHKQTKSANTIGITEKSEDLAIGYIIASETDTELQENIMLLKEHMSFLDNHIHQTLGLFLANQNGISGIHKILNSLELSLKEKYRGIALKIESENKEKTKEIKEKEFIKTAVGIRKEIYKNRVNTLKSKIEQGDINALREYATLIKTAKKLGIK